VINDRLKQLPIHRTIVVERGSGPLERSIDNGWPIIVERVRQHGWRFDPLESMPMEWQHPKQR
jgi:hypothetical protein